MRIYCVFFDFLLNCIYKIMPFIITSTSITSCSMGLAPCPLTVLPNGICVISLAFTIASIINGMPMINIKPYGLCKSPANPAVAAIIASSFGSVTQGPCIPLTVTPWMPLFPTILVAGSPILVSNSILICSWGGVIKFDIPQQMNASDQ